MENDVFNGWFGEFGGRHVPEPLYEPCRQLEEAFFSLRDDARFKAELHEILASYGGRPTPLTYASNLSKELGVEVFLKREDLAHTGSHKLNNVIGQGLLAKYMGKKRLIAETGAGQHGVATATAAALFGMSCTVYMGRRDTERQALNVFRMKLLGAEVVAVDSGSRTLKDAINEALRDWVASVESTHYLIGSVMGPHPYPLMVRHFQSVIGTEAKEQFLKTTGCLPDFVLACVGGGSNAAGAFYPFLEEPTVLVGVEAAGSASINCGSPGIVHGMKSLLLQDEWGQIQETHSVAAGLDYPGVGPEHAYWASKKRVRYEKASDGEVIDAFCRLGRKEGILPALESAHALAYLFRASRSGEIPKGSKVLVILSGRGDKDAEEVARLLGEDLSGGS